MLVGLPVRRGGKYSVGGRVTRVRLLRVLLRAQDGCITRHRRDQYQAADHTLPRLYFCKVIPTKAIKWCVAADTGDAGQFPI